MAKLPDIQTNFAEWYQEVLVAAEVIDSSPTRGCFVIRPYGYAMWEKIQKALDAKIKDLGVKNAYFPLLIPESFLQREKKHIEGFSPELAVVTIGGGEKLEEPLVVRPTSETMIYHMFARWIKSWRDLPLNINQWANVVRWEMRTRPFVRSLEFLWQEGHTAHRTHAEAVAMAEAALAMYKDMYENYLAVPAIAGMKSENERFAGAERTYTIETLMQDGKALQGCTSHVLTHSFPESFDVRFQDSDGTMQVPYCTSWGFTTRSIGAVIMSHGDNDGLIIPPAIAPHQVAIVPIFKTDEERAAVVERATVVHRELEDKGITCIVDADPSTTPGAKFFHWEVRGVPVRLEIGPKDLANNTVVLVNRMIKDKTLKKQFVGMDSLVSKTQEMLTSIQKGLLERARERVKSQWHQGKKIAEFGPSLEASNGMYQTGWCGQEACEAQIKTFKSTIRCLLDQKQHTTCFGCSAESISDILVAKAY